MARSIILIIFGVSLSLSAAEDAAFDFTNDSVDRLLDVQSRLDEGHFGGDTLPLDVRNHLIEYPFVGSPVVTSIGHEQVEGKENESSGYSTVVDPELLEQDVPTRDYRALKALQDDHVFFKKIETKEITTAESYRDALHDCQDLLYKSSEGIKKADPLFYASVKSQFISIQNKVMVLIKNVGALQAEKIKEVEKDIDDIKGSVIARIGSFIFKNLIIDALTLAGRKLSHVRANVIKNHQVVLKKKKQGVHHKDSRFQVEESPYIDY